MFAAAGIFVVGAVQSVKHAAFFRDKIMAGPGNKDVYQSHLLNSGRRAVTDAALQGNSYGMSRGILPMVRLFTGFHCGWRGNLGGC